MVHTKARARPHIQNLPLKSDKKVKGEEKGRGGEGKGEVIVKYEKMKGGCERDNKVVRGK